MAFGKFSTSTNIQAKAAQLSGVDEGLRSFMLRVYSYMTAGLAITGFVAWLIAGAAVVTDGSGMVVGLTSLGQSLYGSPLGYVAIFAPLGIILWISFGINRMKSSTAQTLFWVLAACYGISLSSIFIAYTGATIVRVFFITSSMFLAMSLWGYTTKKSLVGMGSFLMMGLIGLIIASIVNMFMESSALQFALSIIGVIIFAGLTAYDTQMLKEIYVEGESGEMSTKKAVMGALKLYLDFLLLFQYLLMLFANRE